MIVFFIGLITLVSVCVIAGYLDNKKGIMTKKIQQVLWFLLPILACILLFIGLVLIEVGR